MTDPVYERADILLYHDRWEDVLPTLTPDEVDCVIQDPPYGMGLETWDIAPDIPGLLAELSRLQPEYVSTFCQMPFMLDVAHAARAARWHFTEHIAWVKRNTTPAYRLSRSHESILIHAPGKSRKFYTTRGPYEDVRVPGVLVDTISLEGVQRTISDMRLTIQRGQARKKLAGTGATISSLSREGFQATFGPALGTSNFTNVWSFLPPASQGRSGTLRHVSMKPVPVCQRLIEMTCRPGGTVLDPFAGSGTTGIAAALTGHPAILVEADERYIQTIIERIDAVLDEARQHALSMEVAD